MLGRTNLARHLEFTFPLEPDGQDDWPSWVPHFSKSIPYHVSLSTYEQALSWNTSYDSAVELGPVQKASLMLKGVRLSTVGKLYINSQYHKADGPDLASLFEQVKQDLADYEGPGTLAEAFAQTITAGDLNVVSEDDLVRYIRTRPIKGSSFHPDPLQYMANPDPEYQVFLSNDGHMGFGPRPMLGSEV